MCPEAALEAQKVKYQIAAMAGKDVSFFSTSPAARLAGCMTAAWQTQYTRMGWLFVLHKTIRTESVSKHMNGITGLSK